jgi:hypothetical protein
MVLASGTTKMLGTNAHIASTYSPTWANAHAWHNHVDGGEVKFDAIYEDFWETNSRILIICSFYNVSQFPIMYRHKHVKLLCWMDQQPT